MAQFLVQSPVGAFNTVFDGLQYSFWEKLVSSTDHDICLLPTIQVFFKLRWIKRLVCRCIVTIPAQYVIARAPDQDIGQEIRQFSLAFFDQPEIILEDGRVHW